MDTVTNTKNNESFIGGMVHNILSHSYTVFLLAVVFGLILDVFIPIYIFNDPIYQYIGLSMIVLGPAIIYWAQSTSNATKVGNRNLTERNFERGPYKYSRNPTHIGLSIMTIGLGFLLNSVFSILLVAVASLITKFIFLRKEEGLLEKRYGQAYLDYKKKVSSWL